jgi:ABC-type uncharacterized transport system substrate-binding protein
MLPGLRFSCAKPARPQPKYVRESQTAARGMGIALTIENARDVNDLDAMFLAVSGASVVLVADDAEFTARRAELARLGIKHRLPTISGLKEMVEAGGLMAYGGSFAELYRRAASHVHKILQGTSPAALPVEQATKFELVLKPQDGEGARPRGAADLARARRRGD